MYSVQSCDESLLEMAGAEMDDHIRLVLIVCSVSAWQAAWLTGVERGQVTSGQVD